MTAEHVSQLEDAGSIRPTAVRTEESSAGELARRIFDLMVALPLFIVSLPVMLILGTLIRLDSHGPVVFRQRRVGRNRELFTFYKFRTMFVDARIRFPEMYRYKYDAETIKTMHYKVVDDPRLTRVGRYLRKTSLDELPNLWNVVRGHVTLVGPRPEIPEMLPYYADWQLVKFSVKPGVTGLAQVTGRGLLTFQEVVLADVEYVWNRTFAYDVRLLGRTVVEVIRRQGAF